MKKIIGNPQQTNKNLINLIKKTKINFVLDKFIKDEINYEQCSGFFFIVKK